MILSLINSSTGLIKRLIIIFVVKRLVTRLLEISPVLSTLDINDDWNL